MELKIAPDDKYIEIAKKLKTVKNRKDGFYYQKPVKKKILYFSKDSIVIADRLKYVLIYSNENEK